jgi:signal transduction histidine kinase
MASIPAAGGAVAHGPARVSRRALRIFVPIALGLGILLLAVHRIDRAKDLEVGSQASWGVVQLQAAIFDRELEVLSATLVHLAEGEAGLGLLLGTTSAEDGTERLRRFCQLQRRIEGLSVYDLEGVPRLSVGATDDPAAEREAFERARAFLPGQVYISPFALVDAPGAGARSGALLRFSTLIGDPHGGRHGVLVMTYLARSLVARLSQAALYASGSIYLVDERGAYLVASKDGRTWGIAPGRSFAEDHPDAWGELGSGNFKSFSTPKGMYTFRLVSPESPTELPGRNELRAKVVYFLPRAELFAGSQRALRLLAAGGALVLVGAAVASWRLAQLALQKEERDRALEASERRLRLLSNKLLDAQEVERREIARELHDDVGQLATAITIDLKRAERAPTLAEKDALVGRALEGTSRLLESMHRMAGQIRTGVLDDLGLHQALTAYVTEFGERSGLATELSLQFSDQDVPQNLAVNAYRIVQEALTNVLKHARARSVAVGLSLQDDTLVIDIDDDGRGFDTSVAPDERFGLLGMRERVELLGGAFVLSSGPGQGTHIEARLPLARSEP